MTSVYEKRDTKRRGSYLCNSIADNVAIMIINFYLCLKINILIVYNTESVNIHVYCSVIFDMIVP